MNEHITIEYTPIPEDIQREITAICRAARKRRLKRRISFVVTLVLWILFFVVISWYRSQS